MKIAHHGSVTREHGSKKCAAGRHTLQVDILLQRKEYQCADALFNIFTLCFLQEDLKVSNSLCKNLRACEQCVYFCEHEQLSILL